MARESAINTVKVLGTSIFSGTQLQAVRCLETWLSDDNSELITRLVFTPNPEQLVLARKNMEFRAALRTGDLLLPDGVGVVLAGRVLASSNDFPSMAERIPGRVVLQKVLEVCADRGWRVLLYGGRAGVAAATAQRMQHKYPTLLVRGMDGPQLAAYPTPQEEESIHSVLREFRPRFLAVGLGAPNQELWLMARKTWLKETGVRVGMAVGGSFDVLSGRLRLPPRVLEHLHLEWAFRLWQEPWRWRRQTALVTFSAAVGVEWISKLFRRN